MKLIKVEAFGFKSFADQVILNFDGGVVGIVGPNGSGKSNINDAVRWVLGEQSSKALRGDVMNDVIFAGSKTAKPLNKAQVTLTFDNSEGVMKQYGDTITISRVLERDKSENKYFIDGSVARSKDIRDIAKETGMAKESLAIISQGTISQIAQSTPEERRKIFEEAAGTSKYKIKKEEAIRKLENTQAALDKIKTIVKELNKQLEPLEKQATNAKIFLEKTESLKQVEIGLLVKDLIDDENSLKNFNEQLKTIDESSIELNDEIKKVEDNLTIKNNFSAKIKLELSALNKQINNYNNQLNSLEISFEKEKQRREFLINNSSDSNSKESIEAMKMHLVQLNDEIKNLTFSREELEKLINSNKVRYADISTEISANRIKITQENSKLSTIKTKLDMLLENKRSKSNLFKGTKTIIENSSAFEGYVGPVSELLKVPEDYKIAIEAILQNTLQNIVVEKSETAVKAIEFLKKNNGGRATFIPLSSINAKTIAPAHMYALPSLNGFVGIASDLIEIDIRYTIVKEFLLGNIIIANNIENANKIAKIIEKKYMIVTLDGDIIRVGGIMTGGESLNNNNSLLSIDKNIEQFELLIPQVKKDIDNLTNNNTELENKVLTVSNEINEYNKNLAKISEKLISTRNQFETTKTKYESVSNEKLELSEDVNFENSIERIKLEKIKADSELNAKIEQNDSITQELNNLLNEKTKLEKQLRDINSDYAQIISQKDKLDTRFSYSRKRLSEHYELTLELAKENYTLELPIEEARQIVSKLQNDIKALGNINLDAIKTFEEVSERYNSLKSSEEELSNAHSILIKAIDEMDKIIIAKMQNTVELVNKEFQFVFQAMFGGGTAQIKFVDPEDILESGIDIIAQPPGKSIKNLKLFSGGEKALISISLLFAILKAKPLPLCILDEVEAALDETNVVRFAEFLQKLKETTQFIVITHRHSTMARVDRLYGATMQKRGITSFFSIELDKAKKLVGPDSNNVAE